MEFVTLTTHSGIHLDAPYHYHPIMDRGKPSLTIDEIPREWSFSDGVVLDFRHKADGERTTVEDLKNELNRIQYRIKSQDIVLIQTGRIKPGVDPIISLRERAWTGRAPFI